MTIEEWKIIPSYPNYEASSLGRVRRAVPGKGGKGYVGRMLKPTPDYKGYLRIDLCKAGKSRAVFVHFCVTEAFHGPKPTPAHEVAHWDGTRTNNTPTNLRWATSRENWADSVRHGRVFLKGERHGMAKLTRADVDAIRERYRLGGRQTRLAQQFGVSQSLVSQIVLGQIWRGSGVS